MMRCHPHQRWRKACIWKLAAIVQAADGHWAICQLIKIRIQRYQGQGFKKGLSRKGIGGHTARLKELAVDDQPYCVTTGTIGEQ